MTRSIQVVRLLAAVALALAATWFVPAYDTLSQTQFRIAHPGEELRAITPMYAFVVSHAHHAYAVPVAGLLVGSLLIWRRPNWHAIQGVVVAALWILALLWAGHIIVAWQIQNIPIFSGMRWHY